MSKTSSPIKDRLRDCRGVSLVELLVAAVVASVMVFGLVGMLRMMRSEQQTDYYRRQARFAIMRLFEGPFEKFNPADIYIVPKKIVDPDTPSNAADTVRLGRIAQTSLCTVPLEFRTAATNGGYKSMSGDLIINCVLDNTLLSGNSNYNVDAHVVTAKIKWPTGGYTDSLVLTKRLVLRLWE
jgi:hypothetical protein